MYQRKHYVISARLVPDPALRAPRSVTFLGAESGVENRENGEASVYLLGNASKIW